MTTWVDVCDMKYDSWNGMFSCGGAKSLRFVMEVGDW
jgi:hypothetical protein